MKRNIGRPKKPERVCLAVRFEKPFAKLVRTARERKGLEQGPYLQALITIADKLLPNKPRLLLGVKQPTPGEPESTL